MSEEVEKFIHEKMISAMEILHDWLNLHPHATQEEANEELFQILLGKRVQ